MSSDIWNLSTLCRCCHADGDFRSLTEPYTFRKNVEVYSEMLKETFFIELLNPPVTSSDMICEDCVYLVRSAWRFKRQVQECESKFKEYCLNELNSNIKIEDYSDNNSVVSEDHRDLKTLEYEGGEIVVTKVEATNNLAEKIVKTCTNKSTKHKKSVAKNKDQTVKKKSSTVCVGCKIHFSTVSECSEHMDNCKLVYQCKYCGSGYPTYASFTKHLARHVPQTEYICDYCEKTFKYKKTLMKHVKAHMGLVHRLQCDLCSTQCNDSTQLRIHKRTVHENLRPFACDVCDETFKANKRLKIHYRTHTGEKPYHCEICKESFICREYLLTHQTRKHNIPGARVRTNPGNKNGIKEHICHICGKTLGTKYVLERHIQNRHLNMKRFPCGICGKRFVEKGSMNRHISSIHNPERKKSIKVSCTMCKMKVVDIDKHMEMHFRRPHACSVCLKRFSQKNALNRHIKDVHALIKEHVCAYCGAAYVIKHRLKLHIEKYHNTLKIEFEEPN